MPYSTFDPVMRDLDQYLEASDVADELGVTDLLISIEEAYSLLGRAERALAVRDMDTGRDLMKHAAAILEDI